MNRSVPQDHYSLLEIPRDATADNIKAAFRRLALVHHPDVSNRPDAHDYFQRVHEAYMCLSDPDQRRDYDESTAPHGQDVHAGVWIEPWEKYSEVTRQVVVPLIVACQACHGRGWRGRGCVCPSCSGASTLYVAEPRPLDLHCPICDGRGVLGVTCEACDGAGKLAIKKSFSVLIPKGVKNHDVLKLRGAGNFSEDGPPGDVLLTIRVRPPVKAAPRRAVTPIWQSAAG